MTGEIQHKTLRDEVLYIIGRATAPMHSVEIYERAQLADEVEQVSKALWSLKDAGKIARVEGAGRARYTLAEGVAAPAPAGKTGRSKAVQADDAAGLLTVCFPIGGIRPADIPTLADPGISLNGAAGKTTRKPADHVANAGKEIKPSPRCEQVSKLLDTDAERLADAVIARLKMSLTPVYTELQAIPDHPAINIHIAQIDIHLGGL